MSILQEIVLMLMTTGINLVAIQEIKSLMKTKGIKWSLWMAIVLFIPPIGIVAVISIVIIFCIFYIIRGICEIPKFLSTYFKR